ncbi:phenylalanine--tRNA ligase subunit alpha [Mycoplasmopsis opalescens]|uniref:phenylalanine--tRNA ligase subunit alpha n=1 Tax=Mycoplasmopsis opalescens TaxID=114886 RepID=UPI0004A7434F|nr:phenylalanine--tRNA ligase subunit alpha [Mycoplasmopsis opalescens]
MVNFDQIKNLEELKLAKNKLFSKGSELFNLQQELRNAPFEQKKEIGLKITQLKQHYEAELAKVELRLEEEKIQAQIEAEFIDVTKPVNEPGSLHPITIIENRLRDWFTQNGYYEAKSGEIVSDLYNFERLNIPEDHPARASHDSLYINSKTLLRTHNTGITAEELEKHSNKSLNIFAIGKVYRNDVDDATHSHQFTQVDFVSVGKVSFPNLIWTLKSLLTYVFEEKVDVRFRPSFFPFTEPSVEVDIFFRGRWIEVLGAGMLHPKVLKLAGFNTHNFNGLAAGIGIERIAMIKYGINDIRELYKNDLRVLKQFNYEK